MLGFLKQRYYYHIPGMAVVLRVVGANVVVDVIGVATKEKFTVLVVYPCKIKRISENLKRWT